MAEQPNLTKYILLGAAAAGAYFLLKGKGDTAAATTDAWASAAATTPTGTSTATPAAIAAAVAAASGAAPAAAASNLPAGVAELAARAGIDTDSMLAFLQWDAIISGHPDDLSTRYFLTSAQTWADFPGYYQRYKNEGIPQLASAAGLSQVSTLAIVFADAKEYGHPTELSTSYFLQDQGLWASAAAKYRTPGMAGLGRVYAGPRPQYVG